MQYLQEKKRRKEAEMTAVSDTEEEHKQEQWQPSLDDGFEPTSDEDEPEYDDELDFPHSFEEEDNLESGTEELVSRLLNR